MKKLRQYFILAIMMAAFSTSTVRADYCNPSCAPTPCCEPAPCCAPAYNDCCDCSYLSAAAPIAVLIIAAVVIATTGSNHHHHSSSSSSSSSSSHSHCF